MRARSLLVGAIGCGTFLTTLDSSMVNLALPAITREFGLTLNEVKWVVVGFLLTVSVLLLPLGRLADSIGRKPVYCLGFALFAAGATVSALSPEYWMLLLGRIIQAFGAAMLFCVGPALVAEYFEKDRGEKIGILSMVVSAGLLIGPAVAGQVLTHFNWRALFWMELPLVLAAFTFGLKVIPKDAARPSPTGLPRQKFDALGAISQAIILISFFLYLDAPMSQDKQFFILFVLFAAIALFLVAERRHSSPIFDFTLLRRKRFAIGNILTFLNHLSFSTIFVLMPFYMEEVLRHSAQRTGFYMATIPAIMFVVSPISGWWSDRIGSRGMVLSGTVIIACCLLWMSGFLGGGLSVFSTSTALVINLGVVGFAMAVFQSPNNNSIMSVVPKDELGTASAMVATIRNLGMVAGTSFATGIFTWRQNLDGDFLGALHFTHFSAFLVATLSFGAALLQISRFFEKKSGHSNQVS